MTRSPLLSLTPEQWESLCDGCGRCCLVKLEDEDTGELHYTNVTCRYLDTETCRCTDYKNRTTINPRCMKLSPEKLEILELMPTTCAYRLSMKVKNRAQTSTRYRYVAACSVKILFTMMRYQGMSSTGSKPEFNPVLPTSLGDDTCLMTNSPVSLQLNL